MLSLSTFGRSAAGMTIICNIGVHRRPQTIAQVLREGKIDHVIKSVVLMQKLQSAAASVSASNSHHAKTDSEVVTYTDTHLSVDQKLEVQNAKKCFRAMDYDNSGCLERSELDKLMILLGFKLSPDSLQAILKLLDVDSDGRVSETEFLHFYAKNILKGTSADHGEPSDGRENHGPTHHHRQHSHHHSLDHELHHLGCHIFEKFDADKSGEITLSEFQNILESFNVGFSIDELGSLVNEIDISDDGTIGEHEFVSLLEKHRHLFEVHRLPDL
jgi:Ca2+-binding EF-hand superfamily protein